MSRSKPSATEWLCDGHGHWISPLPDCDLMVASEARKLGAPVPDDEQDPEPVTYDLGDEEMPF